MNPHLGTNDLSAREEKKRKKKGKNNELRENEKKI
jgi:hypothetical protein